jgi:hypothetical protein
MPVRFPALSRRRAALPESNRALRQWANLASKGFRRQRKEYRDAGLGEWTGFYDWLKAADGSLLGVRYWLNASTEFLATYAAGLAYVIVDPSRSIEVYSSDRRALEPKLSCDQAFLYNAVFRAGDGEYAIAFGAEDLSAADFNILEQSGLHPAESRA